MTGTEYATWEQRLYLDSDWVEGGTYYWGFWARDMYEGGSPIGISPSVHYFKDGLEYDGKNLEPNLRFDNEQFIPADGQYHYVETEFTIPTGYDIDEIKLVIAKWWDGEYIADYAYMSGPYGGKARFPIPLDGVDEIPRTGALLSWLPGSAAASTNGHDVYFGTDETAVYNADTTSPEFQTNRTEPNWSTTNYASTLELFRTYYWRVDEVNVADVNSPWKGDIWSFTVEGRAKNPVPADGAANQILLGLELSWDAGAEALTHDVYFGSDSVAVLNADTTDTTGIYQTTLSIGTESYTVPVELTFGTKYYWRIDENSASVTAKGDVWSFTTVMHLTVDDFDSYAINDDLWAVWDDYWTNDSGSGIYVEKEIAQDGNSLMFEYDNGDLYKYQGNYLGSFIDADITDLEIGPDWTVSDARALVIYFYGQPGNSATVNDRMWVELEDTSSNTGVVIYDGDPNDVKEAEWHEWNIDLGIFDACGVSLTNLDKVHLGFGNFWRTGQAEKGGEGTVYFDDIQVWPQRCIPVKASIADFTDDCIVDGYDLETMMEDWLLQDYNTIGYEGTLRGFTEDPCDPNYDLCWVTGRIGTGALEFGVGHILTDPNCTNTCYEIHEPELDDDVLIPRLGLNTNTVTFTCWAKAHGPQWPDTGLFGCDGQHGEFTGDTIVNWDLATNGASDMGYNWNNDNDTWNWNPGLPELPYNNWAFAALVIGPSQATIYIKEDGDPELHQSSNTYDHAPEPFDIPAQIGSHKLRYFDGVIDDFRIYNKTLSIDEIEWLAYEGAQGTDPTGANLHAHYKFDDGSGLTAEDSAGTGLNYWAVPSVANIAGDDIEPEYSRFVNLIDFAALADDWLVDMPWPRP
jgi:hypothetical protein